jgi:hypothetical protein
MQRPDRRAKPPPDPAPADPQVDLEEAIAEAMRRDLAGTAPHDDNHRAR